MKRLRLLVLLPLLITGCTKQGENTDSNKTSDESHESEPTTVSEEESETYSDTYSEPIIPIENRYDINPYGDYLAYLDSEKDPSNLESEYTALSKTVTGEKNGIFQSSYQQGLLDFFDINNKVILKINISNEELNKLNQDHYHNNRESFRICSVDITINDLFFHFEEVGIRQKGNMSRGEILTDNQINLRHYKLSFEETFDDEYTETPMTWTDEDAKEYRKDRSFFGLSKIDVRWNRNKESTYIREYYAYEMYRGSGTPAPRTNPVNFRMKVDDKEYNLGVYLAVETLTKSFIKRNFVKSARNGDLYKLSWGSGQGAKFNPVNDDYFGVEYQSGNSDWYDQHNYTYELKTNKDTSTHAAVKSFISNLNDQHGDTIYDFMQENAIYDSFLTYLAVQYLLGDPDDLRGNYNNTYVYFTGDTNQMVLIPTDHDRVMGSTGGSGDNPTGHFGALNKPFDRKTGYGGDNDSKLYNVTLFSSNSTVIPGEYLTRIDEVIQDGWMDVTTYQSYFDIAKEHYQNDVKLTKGIIGNDLSFNMKESDNLYGKGNLSISVYLENKVNTFNNNKGQ